MFSEEELRAFRQQVSGKAKPQPKKSNFLTSLISEGGAIGGGAAGAAAGSAILPGVGTLLGGALGAGIGAFGGRVAENKVRDNRLGIGDAAREGALSAVLGAGPLRLGRAAVETAKGAKAGLTLTEALAKAGTKATNMSATRAVGNKLSQASDDLVIKQFRLMPSQITNFRKKFGEDPSAVIKRYNLTGKDSEGIKQAVIAPLQGEFDSIASKIPAIPTTTIQKAFKTKYDKLLNSAVQDNKAVGLQLKKQADEIVKKYGDTIDGSEVASLRREFDSLVSYADKAANPARYNVNKRAADALRSALQETADKVGLKSTDGKSFKEVGAELNKLRQLTDNIGKQENLGRGNLPFSLGNTPGTIIGSAAGPVGAFAGYAGNAVVNSPAGRRAIAATAEKAGTRFTQAADRSNPYSVSQLAGRILPASALGAALSGQSDLINSSTNANPTTTSANTPNAANITELYQALNNSSIDNSSLDSGPFAPENLQNSIQTILANGGDLKDASEFIGLAKALQDIKDTSSKKEKPLSAEAAKTVSNARAGLSALDTIEQQLLNDPSVQQKSAISGTFNPSGLTARLLGTGTYENARQQAVDLIARIRTGAAVTKEEAKRFEVFLPQPSDTPETIRQKMKILREQFEMVANRSGTAGNDLQVALSA